MMPDRAAAVVVVMLLLGKVAFGERLEARPLTLDVHVAKTANVFHVVDQLSEWSVYCHKQYAGYMNERAGGLSAEDHALLKEHAGLSKTHGWGEGLEQAFYTTGTLGDASKAAVTAGRLSQAEADTELRVLRHFAPRVEQLLASESGTLQNFINGLRERNTSTTELARQMARFVSCKHLEIPVYLIANPDKSSSGGWIQWGAADPGDFQRARHVSDDAA